jgi:hypothetical protein
VGISHTECHSQHRMVACNRCRLLMLSASWTEVHLREEMMVKAAGKLSDLLSLKHETDETGSPVLRSSRSVAGVL